MRTLMLAAAMAAMSAAMGSAAQQAGTAGAAATKDQVDPQQIIQKFAAKEAEFRQARDNYTYRQTVKMEELDPAGNPSGGMWYEVDDITFTPEGKRFVHGVNMPVPTLQHIGLDAEDQSDLLNIQPFVLTTDELPKYEINYLGREKVDEIGCYTFSVKPKKLVKGDRYFEGEIWVDDRDFQIVKTYGKAVGIVAGDHQYPRFETYREQIDGRYWFPTYTHADDTLHFKDMDQRISMTVRYQDYKRYEGKSTIKYGNMVDDKKGTTAPPATKKK